MNDNIKELLELINENPELPIICMVDGDIVGDDSGRWMAQIGRGVIGEFTTYNERLYDDREEFTDDYYVHNGEILCERFGYNPLMPNKEAETRLDKYLDEVANRAFKKAILVYIDTPDETEEFENENVTYS